MDITKFEVMEDHMRQKVKIMAVVEFDISDMCHIGVSDPKRLIAEHLTIGIMEELEERGI